MPKPNCVYFGPGGGNHRLTTPAYSIVSTYFNIINDPYKADVIISFLSDKILKDIYLEKTNINFHPAPPKYPGRGGASYALYNADEYYGATAHQMIEQVDAGKVYWTSSFPIRSDDTCETLFEKAEYKCLELLLMFCSFYREYNCMPNGHTNQWSGPAKTKKDFQEFLDLTPHKSFGTELIRKIKATRHSKFPGPYITIHGYKFELCKDQS